MKGMFATCILLAVLETSRIVLGGQALDVEIADTPKTRETGLMGRSFMEDGRGMLFVFDKPEILSFWMKNTRIPLSIGFFDEKKRLIETVEMAVPLPGAPLAVYRSSKPSLYALEVPAQWFSKKRIEKGAEFSFLDPP